MRLRVFVLLCFIALLARVPAATAQAGHGQEKADPLSGKYEGTFKSDGGDISAAVEIKNDEGKLSGRMETVGHGSIAGPINGTFAEGRVTMSFALGEQGEHKGTVTATLNGDSIFGKWESDGGGGTVELKRAGNLAQPASVHAQNPYGPYEYLAGTWDVTPEAGSPVVGVARFRWGPNRSYIWIAASLMVQGAEQPHFEGLLMWNGMHKNLDMLLAVDLQSGLAQEQGTFSVQPDGTFVREITGIFSEGVRSIGRPVAGPQGDSAHFRQTYKALGPDRMLTVVLRETEHGWVPTFTGSDHLVMTRRRGN